uniref:Putative insect pheromone-binding family n=1 Tax=Culex tarsalis TaxID=7177 RepID=A0A1Q3FPV5_CULTA
MRNVWIVVASGLLAFANFVKSQETQGRTLYSSRYDNLDIDTILSSNRLVNNYVDCLLSRKPCPPEGKDLKRILPEALRTKCGRCSSTQKENALKIITTLYYSYPDQYQALRERWDPSGEYHRRFEEYLRGIQFNQIGGNGNGNGNGNGPSERPVRNDFDRDQSQILLQTLILSTTTSTTAEPPVPEQRPPQLASAQLTQPVAPITSTTTTTNPSTTTTTTTATTTTSTSTTMSTPIEPTPNSSVEPSSPTSTSATSGGESGEAGASEPPTSIPATDSQPTVGPLSNRFGDDDSVTPVTTTSQRPPVQQTQPTTQRPVVVRQTTARVVTQRTTSRFNFQQQPPSNQQGVGGGAPPAVAAPVIPNNVIDNFFIPPGQQNPGQQNGGGAQSPFVGLFNQIGNKLATTADAIAGMLRKTVDVIVTSHIQSHQRALRSFGAQ